MCVRRMIGSSQSVSLMNLHLKLLEATERESRESEYTNSLVPGR